MAEKVIWLFSKDGTYTVELIPSTKGEVCFKLINIREDKTYSTNIGENELVSFAYLIINQYTKTRDE